MKRDAYPPMRYWHQWSVNEVAQSLRIDVSQGLSQAEAKRRLAHHGANVLVEHPPKSIWLMLWEQLIATTVVILLIAAGIAAILGDYKDTIAILAIVIFNASLGVHQEYTASQALVALKRLAIPTIRVLREGQWQEISAQQLVPGDIVQLETGTLVPADGRVCETIHLQLQESAFTGESEPVEKISQSIDSGAELPLGDRHNMVYRGTTVSYGRGKVLITETGMATELGRIAHLLQTVEQSQTPLQQRIDRVGKRLAMIAIALVGVVFGLGLLRHESFTTLILTAVSLAVAIIPEGLPAIVTIALAIGGQKMLRRQALIRKLPAVETLGAVTVICSDKTGTLTENRMTAIDVWTAAQVYGLSAETHHSSSNLESVPTPYSMDSSLLLTLMSGALCNNAILSNEVNPIWEKSLGDPTELALLLAAYPFGLLKSTLESMLPRIAEIPFDAVRKRMTTVHSWDRENEAVLSTALRETLLADPSTTSYLSFCKGAVGSLLPVVTHLWIDNSIVPLDDHWRSQIVHLNDQWAQSGVRVLGLACGLLEELPVVCQIDTIEHHLIFLGMVGLMDPMRPAAQRAIQICQSAGIRPILITGDHPQIALSIAKELAIASQDRVLSGQELAQLSGDRLLHQVDTVSVYARVSPEQKLQIVESLQQRGHIVAMTGDGVNDAPALRKADIGVAMGRIGTDVAKEAADMILLNDDFATIVAAVEEGRVIYDNIRKFIRYTLTGNASGVWIMLLAPLLSMPLPLLPIQILWINLLADGLLALALSVEPAERNTMQRPPYHPKESLFSRGVGQDIIGIGSVMGMTILALGYAYWSHHQGNWQTMVFSTLAFSRISLALAMRSEQESLFRIGWGSNRPMLAAVLLTALLQVLIVHFSWGAAFFQTKALSLPDLGVSLGISTIGFWAIEFKKLWQHLRSHSQ
jgi:P-type Ca2+ transporter type 2C